MESEKFKVVTKLTTKKFADRLNNSDLLSFCYTKFWTRSFPELG